jgi:hypothetical protein
MSWESIPFLLLLPDLVSVGTLRCIRWRVYIVYRRQYTSSCCYSEGESWLFETEYMSLSPDAYIANI